MREVRFSDSEFRGIVIPSKAWSETKVLYDGDVCQSETVVWLAWRTRVTRL